MKTKQYIQPTTQVIEAALLIMDSVSGNMKTNVVEDPKAKQSESMSPARTLYI